MKKFVSGLFLTLYLTVSGQVLSEEVQKDSNKLAFSYGAQALDMLELADKIIENQKVTIVLYKGLADTKDLKVEVLNKAITRIEQRSMWQKIWAWIRGALAGAVVTFLVISA